MSDRGARAETLRDAADTSSTLPRLLASTAANRAYQQAIMLAILVLTARWLGPEGRGALAAAIAWVQLGGTAAGMSLGKAGFVHSIKTDGGLSSALLATTIAIFGVAFVALIIAVMGARLIGGVDLLSGFTWAMTAFVLVAIPLYVWEDAAFYLLTSQSLLAKNMAIVSFGRTLSLGAVAAFVLVLPMGTEGALLGLVIGQIVSGFLTFFAVRAKAAGPFQVSSVLLRDQIGKSLALHPQTVAIAVLGASDVLLLHALSGDAAAGIYQAAWSLMAIAVFASAPVGNVLYQVIAERGADGAWVVQRKLIAWTFAAFTLTGVGVWFFAQQIVTALLGGAFDESASVLVGLLPLCLAQVLSNVMTPQWIARNLLVRSSAIAVALAVVSVTANAVLIPGNGVWGAVATSWIVASIWIGTNAAFALAIELRRMKG